ncbi:MAG: valine--tRNA ligase [Candidatus Nezhaarchaeota archaeon]|nr:valine--tRNA ligase [Candidatus Nezhaarchaeota archaeon]
MGKLEKFNPKDYELKWIKCWDEKKLYSFDRSLIGVKPVYVIDTPPPYPSGEFHVGNSLNWCYMDFVARYKRMQGFNVFFPQGWDCHGLPTEVRAERTLGVKRRDMDPREFKALCVKLTEEWIKPMKESIKRLGFSVDWSLEYKTMDPGYWRKTQLSFVLLHEKGLIYKGEHPVNWCPRCETAIAEAEIEYVERATTLNYVVFEVEGREGVTVATTRPELISSCVAVFVNPLDERYKNYVGLKARLPIFGREVPIMADEAVDMGFGSGAVMVCTYGDKTDVRWQKRYGLPVITSITDDGRMNENAGPYSGLSVEEARKRIIHDLEAKGLLLRKEPLIQSVGTCWRCHVPVEILPRTQWFMKTTALKELVERKAGEIRWVPPYAKQRLLDWVKSMDWDWVISRQRVFATPIPVWYCRRCGHTLVAKPEWLPVDPRDQQPPVDGCPMCSSKELIGESDVLDTWMDSSITCAAIAGWPDDMELFAKLYPNDLQPNGYDIIRTWDYYLLVRHLALFGEVPYKVAMINGMVRGTDGRMMHKSYGNYIEVREVVEKYCADALRQWAASGSTGYDIRFRWEDVDYAWRFLIKLWNASKFVVSSLAGYNSASPRELNMLDLWLLTKLKKTVEAVTESMESMHFNDALESVRNFTWHVFCDHYLEAVKYRLYGQSTIESKRAAQYTLRKALFAILKLLAPFCPFITEEIYQASLRESVGAESIHLTEWPKPWEYEFNPDAEAKGDVVVATIAAVRRSKIKRRLSPASPLKKLWVSAGAHGEALKQGIEDVKATCRVGEVVFVENLDGGLQVEDYPDVLFMFEV